MGWSNLGRLRGSLALLACCLAAPLGAQFADTEVSGPGAEPFRLARDLWTWEALPRGVTYTLYESASPRNGFTAMEDGFLDPFWSADFRRLGAERLQFYLVTANDGSADNSPGLGSGGTTRALRTPPRCAGGGAPLQGVFPLRLRRLGDFANPMLAVSPPGDTDRLFVGERAGTVRILHRDGSVSTFLTVPNVITGSERGLLGLAFHPDYATSGLFYVHYSVSRSDCGAQAGVDHCGRIAAYQVTTDPDVADPAPLKVLLDVHQPAGNHDGGWIGFRPGDDPDHLYIALGDGGGRDDQFGNGQNFDSLLGAILRIDVSGDPYDIPADNPFAGAVPGLGEIWAWGLRNPWRNSFDRETGDLYIADVGQNQWEEIDIEPASSDGGLNFGWNTMEGAHCFSPPSGCDRAGLETPVWEYSHASGCSITGGYVYRGCRMPDLGGEYFFGDYCEGWVQSFRWTGGPIQQGDITSRSGDPGWPAFPFAMTSFGQDAEGEIYVVELGNPGGVYRIEPILD